MTDPFPRWSHDLVAANSAEARRALVLRINQWRAANLIDVVGQRDSAWALSHLLMELGDKPGAEAEARSLHSLCSTPPKASAAQIDAAEARLGEVLGRVKPAATPASRAARGERAPRAKGERPGAKKERASPQGSQAEALRTAVDLGRAGKHSQGFKVLKGVSGERASVVRTWLDLHRALTGPEAQRLGRLEKLLARLERELPASSTKGSSPASERSAGAPNPPAPTSRVGRLLGQEPSAKRARALSAMHAYAQQGPAQADAMAEAALRDQLDQDPGAAAPWLVGLVARAVADEAPSTLSALRELGEQGASFVELYADAPFTDLVTLWRRLRAEGLDLQDFRCGIMRGEPEGHQVWTARFAGPAGRFMVAVAAERSEQSEPVAEGHARAVARRIAQLGAGAFLYAPGPGHAELRELAVGEGLRVVDSLEQIEPSSAPRPRTEPRSERATLLEAVRGALTADPAPTVEELRPLVAPIRRARDVLDLASQLDMIDVESRVVALLRAVDAEVDPKVRLMQAVSMILRLASNAGPQSDVARLLLDPPTADRFGGPGAEIVIQVGVALQQAGFALDRVLRGVTRREAREHRALEALGPAVEDLWRLVFEVNGVRGEVWVAQDLPPEGRGALPLLALSDRPQVAVLPVESSLLLGWSDLGGPEAIGWTGAELDQVVQAVRSWQG